MRRVREQVMPALGAHAAEEADCHATLRAALGPARAGGPKPVTMCWTPCNAVMLWRPRHPAGHFRMLVQSLLTKRT